MVQSRLDQFLVLTKSNNVPSITVIFQVNDGVIMGTKIFLQTEHGRSGEFYQSKGDASGLTKLHLTLLSCY